MWVSISAQLWTACYVETSFGSRRNIYFSRSLHSRIFYLNPRARDNLTQATWNCQPYSKIFLNIFNRPSYSVFAALFRCENGFPLTNTSPTRGEKKKKRRAFLTEGRVEKSFLFKKERRKIKKNIVLKRLPRRCTPRNDVFVFLLPSREKVRMRVKALEEILVGCSI